MVGPRYGMRQCREGHGSTRVVTGGCVVDPFEDLDPVEAWYKTCGCTEGYCKAEQQAEEQREYEEMMAELDKER